MKYPESTPSWVCEAAESISVTGDIGGRFTNVARKLAAAHSLGPLWKVVEKKASTDAFWLDFFGPDHGRARYFKHLVTRTGSALEPLSGYAAMTPAKLDEWRKRTQSHALALMSDLMDGYPEIALMEDDAYLTGGWVFRIATHLATKGAENDIGKLISSIDDAQLDHSAWASAFATASRLPMVLRYLIEWLDGEAAENHTVTHAASKNAQRNSFIRSMTLHFQQFFDTPKRKHVFNMTALFFELEGLTESDIKKIAPAGGRGRIPRGFLQNFPG